MSEAGLSAVIAKDQWWSWSMLSSRGVNSTPESHRLSFFLARNAIYHSLAILGIEKGKRVLLPAYICAAAVEPFIAFGLKVDFYNINRDCTVDEADLQSKVTPDTKAVLMVHYFGFPQKHASLRALCDRNGMALIEDCAHVLRGESDGKPLGSIGDASVFSWRKFLPLYDGADLVLNRPGRVQKLDWVKESPMFTLKVAVNVMEASLSRTRQPILKVAYSSFRAADKAVRAGAKSLLRSAAVKYPESSGLEFDASSLNWPMSRLSRWTLAHSDVAKIVSARKRNYELLVAELSRLSGVTPLHPTLPPATCPWVLPVFFDNRPNGHLALRSEGIPAVTWGGVRHRFISGEFTDAGFLYENLVFLPVHQCLDESDIFTMLRTIKKSLTK